MRNHFVKGLEMLAENDEHIYLITGDLGFGVLNHFAERFPQRFVNAGISEQNMASVAAGIALEGNTVYVYSIGNFPTLRCLEQIRNDICYHNANVKIVAVGGGFAYGQLGMSHHATEDLAIMRALPNMRVFSPADPMETLAALNIANEINGPCYIRLGKGGETNQHPDLPVENAMKDICVRYGEHINIFSTGSILSEAKGAAERLAELGISAGVYSCLSIKPFDEQTVLQCAMRSSLLLTVEEHNTIGGLGGAVAECLSSIKGVHAPLIRIGLEDTYSCVVGSQQFLRQYYHLDADSIAKRALRFMEDKTI